MLTYQGYSGGWDGGLCLCARLLSTQGRFDEAPALHYSPCTWFKIFLVTLPTRGDGACDRPTSLPLDSGESRYITHGVAKAA